MAILTDPETADWYEKPEVGRFGPEDRPSDELNPYLEPLPVYDVGIEHTKTRQRHDLSTPFGYFFERHVTMSDGEQHTEIIGLSKNPDAEKLVVSIPAWWTSPVKGFNKETADKFHRRGFHTLVKGVSENKAIPLSRSASDTHLSLDYDDGFGHYFSTDSVLFHGDSNGAMQGTGFVAYAKHYKRVIEDAYLVDPGLVRKIGKRDIDKFIKHPSYLPKEIFSLAKQIVRMVCDPEEATLNYAGTIDPSVGYVVGNLLLSRALFSGEFGNLLAHVPANQKVHFLLFNHSMANQKQELLDTLEPARVNEDCRITTETRTGSHLSIANPRTIKDKVNYIDATSDLSAAS